MASNRLNPRSWVSGLHIPVKYMPIRAGRGIWHRNYHVAIRWDEPEGYRALVHEWAHYALELRDLYLDPRQFAPAGPPPSDAAYTVVVPNHAVASASIMTTLEGTSELVAKTSGSSANRKSEEWQVITKRYPWLNPSQRSLDGPGRLPLPLPRFQRLGALADDTPLAQSGARADLLLRDLPGGFQPDRCWVYVLPGLTSGRPYPQRVIAQGTLDARTADDGFRLLGARAGDTVVLIGEDDAGRATVFRGAIDLVAEDGQALARVAEWRVVTPAALPLIDVLPGPAGPDARMAQISVRVDSAGGPPPDQVWVFPLGQARLQDAIALGRADRPIWTSAPRAVPTLDGHVLALWGERLAISTFSQGGNPSSGSPHSPSPITAGSSDGNALLFFHDEARARVYAANPSAYPGSTPFTDYSGVKVVTTLVHGAPGQPPDGARAHSYAFSLAANAALPVELNPTLAIYYRTPLASDDGDLLVYRREDGGAWRPLPTYLPPGSPFVAAPLDARTGSRLVADGERTRVEYYRIYWTPRNAQANKTG